MKIEKTYMDFDYIIDFGRLMSVIEFSDFGIEKVNEFIIDKVAGYNNVKFKGKIRDHSEFNKLINKLIKENFSISIYIDISDTNMIKLKNVNNIIYNVYLNEKIKYKEEFINFYGLRNSRFIVLKYYLWIK